jgi:hypothetical protein
MKERNTERLSVARGKKRRALDLALLLLLLATTLASTVSHAQRSGQTPNSQAPLVADVPPTEPAEQQFIAQVTIESAPQLATLQQLGHWCGDGAVCEIEATEAQVSVLEQAGFALDIVGVVAESRLFVEADLSQEVGALEAYRYGSNYTDFPIPDNGSIVSVIAISGAPASATVTRVKYDCLVNTFGLQGPGVYTLEMQALMSPLITIWNRLGGMTDGGHDDDTADDKDIDLSGRWLNDHFDGQPVNQPWHLIARDNFWDLFGGEIDFWKLWVYYDTPSPPPAPALIAPIDNVHTCDTTPSFEWSSVSGATGYQIRVDDSSSFSSPAIDATLTGSAYTPTTPLARRQWYWRVRARNAYDYGSWSATRTFYIDSPAGVPTLQSPADGSHTCDRTPDFDWTDAAGALQYRLEVDDSSGFSSPAISVVKTASNYTPGDQLTPGRYYWRVRAESACGQAAWSSVHSVYIDSGPPVPSGPSPADEATGVELDVDLDWAGSAGANSYDVYFGTTMPPPFVATVDSAHHDLPALTASTQYRWKIVAESDCGRTHGPVWEFTTTCSLPGTPSGPSPADGATDVPVTADLDWADASGATSYDVYVGRSPTPPYRGNTPSSSYSLPTLSESAQIYWQIVAKNSCGNTSGPVWAFTTRGRPSYSLFLPAVVKGAMVQW